MKLRPWHRAALRLVADGLTYKEVGKRVGRASTTICLLVRSPEGSAYLRELEARITDTMILTSVVMNLADAQKGIDR